MSGRRQWCASALEAAGSRCGRARRVRRTRPEAVDHTSRASLWQVLAVRDAEREAGLAVHLLLRRRALELAVAEGLVRGDQAALIGRRPDVVADGEQLT